jgi:hypothetical protein
MIPDSEPILLVLDEVILSVVWRTQQNAKPTLLSLQSNPYYS